jgi:Ca-activated chloride channel family protein
LTAIWWLVRQQTAHSSKLKTGIADHLTEAMTVNRKGTRGVLPVDGIAIVMLCSALATAGPSFRQQESPWFAETAPLVVALEVSDSMRANDLVPSRLERARFKILDLIAARTGARTSLIAYSGSAHVVMPPTMDALVIKPFLESLDPAIMPIPGANLTRVLPLALDLLGDEAASGTLLIVADGIDNSDVPALRSFTSGEDAPSIALLLAATDKDAIAMLPDGSLAKNPDGSRVDTRVDLSRLQQIVNDAGLWFVQLSPQDNDIAALLSQIESRLEQAEDPDAVWVDDAWWLLWPAVLVMLAWFRRGWTMQWS